MYSPSFSPNAAPKPTEVFATLPYFYLTVNKNIPLTQEAYFSKTCQIDYIGISSNFVEKKMKSEKCLDFTWRTHREHYLFVSNTLLSNQWTQLYKL